MNSRARVRTSVSIGSNQLSKRSTAISAAGCEESGFVVVLVMAWSPVQRFNAGRFEVDHPGDYATLNSYQPRYATRPQVCTPQPPAAGACSRYRVFFTHVPELRWAMGSIARIGRATIAPPDVSPSP